MKLLFVNLDPEIMDLANFKIFVAIADVFAFDEALHADIHSGDRNKHVIYEDTKTLWDINLMINNNSHILLCVEGFTYD